MKLKGLSDKAMKRIAQGVAGQENDEDGYYLMTFGGGQWGSIGWWATYEEAEKERERMMMLGQWSGMPPKVVTESESRELLGIS